jgi:trk system potassium uptake protein TrkA
MQNEYAVIGAGRFGSVVALGLVRLGHSVMVVDRDRIALEAISNDVDAAICADAIDERAFRELRLDRFACVIVGIGAESMQASILVTALLKQNGVPRIISRSVSPLHGRVLRAVGADEVVNPERELGERLAARLSQPNLVDQLPLGDDALLAEIGCPQAWHGATLVSLDVRKRFGVSVVALRRSDGVTTNPRPEDELRSDDILVVVGTKDAVRRIGSLA